jgi:hypothetical protein
MTLLSYLGWLVWFVLFTLLVHAILAGSDRAKLPRP